MINNLDPDSNFIFEKPSISLNFLDINIRIVEKPSRVGYLYKPSNSFNYLIDTSCHSPHTKNNISLSFAKCIVSMVTNNRENRFKGLTLSCIML